MKIKYSLLFILIIFFCCKIQFCFGKAWQQVYLATFPRSGNHWVRYLVEEASNIATSSDRQDTGPPTKPSKTDHMPTPFPWGGYCALNGYEGNRRYPEKKEIVLVKTHLPVYDRCNRLPTQSSSVIKSIRIIRHPIDSLYSMYVLSSPNEKSIKQFVPRNFIKAWIKIWKNFQKYWNNQPNVITYRYEDLLNPYSLKSALTEILYVLKYPVTHDDIERACKKYPPVGRPLKHLDKFRKEDLEMFNRELGDLMKQYGYSIP